MKFERSSGIILHPTSLPGPYGIGELGPQVQHWIDFLSKSGCGLWQVLPLGPTGYGDSPYQCFSAFAGNPYLVNLDTLVKEGLLTAADLAERPDFPTDRVDYGAIFHWKPSVLDRAYDHFIQNGDPDINEELKRFREAQADWIEDFALFMALKDAHAGSPWVTWKVPLRDRQAQALEDARQLHHLVIEHQVFRQFLFFRQWAKVRSYARKQGLQIIGDIPIFVAHDSADVWAHPELYFLDANGQPTVVAGVPPDYFSRTGQLWGNPLYRWDRHKASGYSWWLQRIRAVLELVDIIRLDHFRGFAGYWEVPGKAKTAEGGRWVSGPGADFFEVIQNSLGNLPIIAEDLGEITPDVVALRDQFGLPGMKILQFGFAADSEDAFLPHNYTQNCVVYTGTHDNDTALGWYERVEEFEKDFYRRYMARDGYNVSWDLIRGAWSSVAMFALGPMQDFLSLNNQARMNYPGNPSGNWTWRMPESALDEPLQRRIWETNWLYGRLRPEIKAELKELKKKAAEAARTKK